MTIQIKKSPNYNDRGGGRTPHLLVLHYTGTQSADDADRIYMTDGQVAPHYMIDIDGSVIQYVDEDRRAWHAGHASWAGETDINSASVGIELVNGGHEYGLGIFPEPQISRLIELIKDIRSRWSMADSAILGHSDVAPGRKIDPGEKFPWATLYQAGIGLLPDAAYHPDHDDGRELVELLRNYGYDYGSDQSAIIREFTRHFLAPHFGQDMDYERLRYAALSLLNQKLTGSAIS